MCLLSKSFKTFLQTLAHKVGQPEVKRTTDESRCIRTLGKIVAQAAVHKVGHSLCRGRLLHIPLLPTRFLQLLLEAHHAQGIFLLARHLHAVLGMHLNDHAAVTPCCAAVARTHTVDHDLRFAGGSGNNKATRTHAETVHATAVHLRNESIFCGREICSAAVLVVILYLVNQRTGVFQPHTYGNALGFDFNLRFVQIAVDVACTVPRGQYHRTTELRHLVCFQINRFDTFDLIALDKQTGHLCQEMYLAATPENRVAHVLNDAWKLVGADMRVGIGQDRS